MNQIGNEVLQNDELLKKISQYNQTLLQTILAQLPSRRYSNYFELYNADIDNFLDHDKKVMLISGDVGTGKTVFSLYIANKILQRSQAQQTFIIYIDLNKLKTINQNLLAVHLQEAGFNTDQQTLLKKHYKFIFIFDNYGINHHFNNLYEQLKLGELSAKLIVNCHQALINDFIDETRFFAPLQNNKANNHLLHKIHLKGLAHQQLEETITNAEYNKFIQEHPLLQQLLCNPLILNLFLIEIEKEKKIEISNTLLKSLLQAWYVHFEARYLQAGLISAQDDFKNKCLQTCSIIANKMHADKVEVINYKPSSPLFPQQNPWEVFFKNDNMIKRLIRLSLPLKSLNKSTYQWLSSELQNYFLQSQPIQPTQAPSLTTQPAMKQTPATSPTVDNLDFFKQHLLTQDYAMLQMLADRSLRDPEFRKTLFGFIEKAKKDNQYAIASANAVSTFGFASISLAGYDLSYGKFKGANFNSMNLESANLSYADLTDATFHNAILRNINFNQAILNATDFGVYQVPELTLPSPSHPVQWVSQIYHPDKHQLVVNMGSEITLWDMQLNQKISSIKPRLILKIAHLNLSADGKYLIIGGALTDKYDASMAAELWDIEKISLIKLWHYDKNNKLSHFLKEPFIADPQNNRFGIFEEIHPASNLERINYQLNLCNIEQLNENSKMPLISHKDKIIFHPINGIMLRASSTNSTRDDSEFKNISFINSSTAKHVCDPIAIQNSYITCFEMSKDGKYIILATDKNHLQIWEICNPFGYKLIADQLINDPVNGICINPQQTFFITWSKLNINLYQLPSASLIYTWSEHTQQINTVIFNQAGNLVASASDDHLVILWDVNKKSAKEKLTNFHSEVNYLCFLDKNDQLLAADRTGFHYIWRTQTIGAQPMIVGHNDAITQIGYDATTELISTYGKDNNICTWKVNTGHLIRTIRLPNKEEQKFSTLCKEGKKFIQVVEEILYLWDLNSGNISLNHKFENPITHLAASSDLKNIALIMANTLYSFNPISQKITLLSHDTTIKKIFFSVNGNYLLAICNDQEDQIKIWDINTTTNLPEVSVTTGNITCIATDNKEQVIAIGCEWGHVYLLDIQTGKIIKKFHPDTTRVKQIYFSDNDELLHIVTFNWSGHNSYIFRINDRKQICSMRFQSDITSALTPQANLYICSGALFNEGIAAGFHADSFYRNMVEDPYGYLMRMSKFADYLTNFKFITEENLIITDEKGRIMLWQYKDFTIRKEWKLVWNSKSVLDLANSHLQQTKGLTKVNQTMITANQSNPQNQAIWQEIHLACAKNDKEKVKQLLQINSSLINCPGENNDTPLHIAVEKGFYQLTEVLLAAGANVKAKGGINGYTPLHVAAYFNRAEIAALLLQQRDIDITSRDDYKQSMPLHIAITKGHIALVKLLMEFDKQKTTYEARDKDGYTPFLVALFKGQDHIVKYLFTLDLNISAKSNYGNNALHLAIFECYLETVAFLLQSPHAEFFLKDTNQNLETPLHSAVCMGDIAKIELLCQYPIDFEHVNTNGFTYLHDAVSNGKDDAVAFLFKKNVKMKQPDKARKLPIDHAISKGFLLIVKQFLDHPAYQNISDNESGNLFNTYFNTSNNERRVKIFQLFIDRGLDKRLNDKQWPFLLSISIEKGLADELEIVLKAAQSAQSTAKNANDKLRKPTVVEAYKLFDEFLRWESDLAKKGALRRRILSILLEYGLDIDQAHPTVPSPYNKSIRQRIIKELPDLEQIIKKYRAEPLTITQQAAAKTTTADDYPLDKWDWRDDQAATSSSYLLEIIEKGKDINIKNHLGQTLLHLAVMNNKEDIIRILLRHNIKINEPDKEGETALFTAAALAHVEIVRLLINAGADINQARPDGVNPLLITACRELLLSPMDQKIEVVKLLLANDKINKNATTKDGLSVVHLAIHSEKHLLLKLCLELGCNKELPTQQGETPLQIAIQWGNVQALQVLLDAGVNLNVRYKDFNETVLHRAVQFDDADKVKLLVAKNIDVNAKDKGGNTAIYYAKSKAVIELLLTKKPLISIKNVQFQTPLQFAIACGNEILVSMLLDYGAGEEAQLQGINLLEFLQQTNLNPKIANLLIQRGFKINQQEEGDFTKLKIAVLSGDENAVNNIIGTANISDFNAKDSEGLSLLHRSVQNGSTAITRLLLNLGLDVNCTDNNGETPLHYAVKNYLVQETNLFLDAGADINKHCNQKYTPILMLSLFTPVPQYKERQIIILKKILSHPKLDPKVKGVNGSNAIDLALGQNSDVLQILVNDARFEKEQLNDFGHTPLFSAVQGSKLEAIKILLRSGVNPNKGDMFNKQTPLWYAVQQNLLEIIRELIKAKADVTITNNTYDSLLHIAKTKACVELLIQEGALINHRNYMGMTPIKVAIKLGNKEVVSALLSAGAGEIAKKEGDMLLHDAAAIGSIEIVELIMNANFDIKIKNKVGKTPLDIARMNKKDAVIKFLSSIMIDNNLANLAELPNSDKMADVLKQHVALNVNLVQKIIQTINTANSTNRAIILNQLKEKIGWSDLHQAMLSNNEEVIVQALTQPNIDINCSLNGEEGYGLTPLYVAALIGNLPAVQALLNLNVKIDIATKSGWTAIHAAMVFTNPNQIAIIKLLLQKYNNLDMRLANGFSLLHLAAVNKAHHILNLLLNAPYSLNVNCKDKAGLTPIFWSTYNNDPIGFELLAEAKADLMICDSESTNLLHFACFHQSIKMISLLLASHPALLQATNKSGTTPFHTFCIKNGSADVIQQMLALGANVNAQNNNGWTPLYFLLMNNAPLEKIKLILEKGPDLSLQFEGQLQTVLHLIAQQKFDLSIVQAIIAKSTSLEFRTINQETPLAIAIQHGNIEVAQALMDCGANIEARDYAGNTSLLRAVIFNQPKMIELLLLRNANSSAFSANFNGGTALHITSYMGNTAIAEQLLKKNPNLLESLDRNGLTPFLVAVCNDKQESIQFLIEKKCNIAARSFTKEGALHFAAQGNFIATAKMILQNCPDINIRNTQGHTPLFIAVMRGHIKFVELLLQAKADYTISDNFGLTPLKMAEQLQNKEMCQLLNNININLAAPTSLMPPSLKKAPATYLQRNGLFGQPSSAVTLGTTTNPQDLEDKQLQQAIERSLHDSSAQSTPEKSDEELLNEAIALSLQSKSAP